MKVEAASKKAGREEATAPKAAKGAITAEYPVPEAEPETDAEADVFNEIPTVANHANPTAARATVGSETTPPPASPEGAGSYRILRPTTSDCIDKPAPTKIDPSTSKGVITGAARKTR